MSELLRGAPVPLFDRLASRERSDGAGPSLFTIDEHQASIGRELTRLLNTRSRLGPSEYAQSSGTVLDYGLPDFSALEPRRGDDLDFLQRSIAQAIDRYEPRLSRVSVRVFADAHRNDAAVVSVAGDVRVGLETRRVSFQLPLNQSSAGAAKAG